MARSNKKIKLQTTSKKLTSFSGLLPFANALNNSTFLEKIEKIFFSKKRRNRGYSVSNKINALILRSFAGGKHLSDIDRLNCEVGFKSILGVASFPSKNLLSEFLNDIWNLK